MHLLRPEENSIERVIEVPRGWELPGGKGAWAQELSGVRSLWGEALCRGQVLW